MGAQIAIPPFFVISDRNRNSAYTDESGGRRASSGAAIGIVGPIDKTSIPETGAVPQT